MINKAFGLYVVGGSYPDFIGLLSATPLFLFTSESLLTIFYSENVETNEITVKLPKIVKHTFRNAIYSKTTRVRLTMQYQ